MENEANNKVLPDPLQQTVTVEDHEETEETPLLPTQQGQQTHSKDHHYLRRCLYILLPIFLTITLTLTYVHMLVLPQQIQQTANNPHINITTLNISLSNEGVYVYTDGYVLEENVGLLKVDKKETRVEVWAFRDVDFNASIYKQSN